MRDFSSAPPVLQIQGLHSHYGPIQALHGIDIEVRQGQLVALVGANGAGKTTLLRAISGVQPVSGGTIRFGGADITRMSADQRVRAGICQVPEGRQVFGPMSVEDNLRLGAYTRPKARTGGRPGTGVRAVPGAEGKARADRRHAVRRPAADAGDGARADGPSRSCCCSTSRAWAWRRC